jgi:molybdopterin-guanine dinucleotide biosynthesis protein A
MTIVRILGAVIAGGQSSRFGSDKAFAMLDGRPLIAHVLSSLGAQVDELIVCGRALAGYASLPDYPSAGLGPLGGIAAALRQAASCGFDAVAASACDTPHLPPDLVERLGEQAPAYVASSPVTGFWPTSLWTELERHMATTQDLSIRAWARRVGAAPVDFDTDIPNINTPDDLARHAASVGAQGASSRRAQVEPWR